MGPRIDRLKDGLQLIKQKIAPDPVPNIPEWIRDHRPEIFTRQEVYSYPSPRKFRGQTVLFVGACGALGEEASRQFILHGAERLILAGDNEDALDDLTDRFSHDPEIRRVNPTCHIGWLRLDLSSIAGVNQFLDNFAQNVPSIHILIFNAAFFTPNFQRIQVGNTDVRVEKMLLGMPLLMPRISCHLTHDGTVNCYSQCMLFMGLRGHLHSAAMIRGRPSHVAFVTCHWQGNEYGCRLPPGPVSLQNWLVERNYFRCASHFHLSKLFTTFFVAYYSFIIPVRDCFIIVNTVWPGTLKHSRLYRHFNPLIRGAVEQGRSLFGRSERRAARLLLAAGKSSPGTHGCCLVGNSKYKYVNPLQGLPRRL